jgi:AraC-like DNA-binding protein
MDRIEVVKETISFIERHLAERFELKTIAEAVHYSKYHLHRIFSNAVGMSLHDYVLRRKLTEAAKLLAFSDHSILDVALIAGYESQQAFTDAFGAMYKTTPNQFRRSEVFYPLQLEFDFGALLPEAAHAKREIRLATEADIPMWMELVRLVVDGFPCLEEEEHIRALTRRIRENGAFVMEENSYAIAAMLISRGEGSIDFLGVHPLFRGQGIMKRMVNRALYELNDHQLITTTTFRAGDRADTGHRKALLSLGFAEAEMMTEFGYPTQKMITPGEKHHA